MPYMIRFEGIGSISVCARSLREALQLGEMFERFGKTNIVVGARNVGGVPLNEFRKQNQN